MLDLKASPADPFIPYGRGGAGNMRRRSSINSAWSKIASSNPSSKLTLTSSPDDHYPRLSREDRRRTSIGWSSSTSSTTGRTRGSSIWGRLFKRSESSMQEEEEDAAKVEEEE